MRIAITVILLCWFLAGVAQGQQSRHRDSTTFTTGLKPPPETLNRTVWVRGQLRADTVWYGLSLPVGALKDSGTVWRNALNLLFASSGVTIGGIRDSVILLYTNAIPALLTDGSMLYYSNDTLRVLSIASPLQFLNGALTLRTQMSVVPDGFGLRLVNDSPNPDSSVYYGTNANGVLGYWPFTISGLTSTNNTWTGLQQYLNQVYADSGITFIRKEGVSGFGSPVTGFVKLMASSATGTPDDTTYIELPDADGGVYPKLHVLVSDATLAQYLNISAPLTKTTSGDVGSGLVQTVIGIDADLATLAALGNWKIAYTDGSGVQTALALGAAGTRLAGNGASAAPTFIASDTVGLGTSQAAKMDKAAFDDSLNANIAGRLVYKARITQASTDPPTAAGVSNKTGTTATFGYDAAGTYRLDFGVAIASSADNITIHIQNGVGVQACIIQASASSATRIEFHSMDSGGILSDDFLGNASISVYVH